MGLLLWLRGTREKRIHSDDFSSLSPSESLEPQRLRACSAPGCMLRELPADNSWCHETIKTHAARFSPHWRMHACLFGLFGSEVSGFPKALSCEMLPRRATQEASLAVLPWLDRPAAPPISSQGLSHAGEGGRLFSQSLDPSLLR